MRPTYRLLGTLALTAVALAAPRTARAGGTFFLLELEGGLGEPAYSAGDAVLAYGVSAGMTWKWKALPFRFALLTTLATRQSSAHGLYAGYLFEADRRDIDLYLAQRIGIPIVDALRFYAEIGLGQRWRLEAVDRGPELAPLDVVGEELLLVLAAGLQLRVADPFSIGLRAELTPLSGDPSAIQAATGTAQLSSRFTGMLQLGFHF